MEFHVILNSQKKEQRKKKKEEANKARIPRMEASHF
jgi:hypothetical protein